MPELTIRKGMKNDIDGIALLEKSCFSSPLSADMILKDMTENSMANYIVAELDGVLAGYIGFWCVIEECQINSVAVAPSLRKQHIGTMLLNTCIDAARASGIKRWTLEVRAGNEAAKTLYDRFGFVENGIRKGYYDNPKEDAVLMVLGD